MGPGLGVLPLVGFACGSSVGPTPLGGRAGGENNGLLKAVWQ